MSVNSREDVEFLEVALRKEYGATFHFWRVLLGVIPGEAILEVARTLGRMYEGLDYPDEVLSIYWDGGRVVIGGEEGVRRVVEEHNARTVISPMRVCSLIGCGDLYLGTYGVV